MFFRKFFGSSEDNKKWYHQYCVGQRDNQENNLACITVLLRFFEKKINIKTLKRQFPEHFKESSFENLIELGQKNAFQMERFSCPAIELKNIKLPCLLYWGLDRFVVLIAVENEEYCVLDPGKSRIEYNFNDFECFYCEEGISISFQ